MPSLRFETTTPMPVVSSFAARFGTRTNRTQANEKKNVRPSM